MPEPKRAAKAAFFLKLEAGGAYGFGEAVEDRLFALVPMGIASDEQQGLAFEHYAVLEDAREWKRQQLEAAGPAATIGRSSHDPDMLASSY